MPPVHPTDASQIPFRVHLTGFGPFRDIKLNPSWIAVQPLEGEVLTKPPPPLSGPSITTASSSSSSSSSTPRRQQRRPIELSTSLLPVEYQAVETLAPKLQVQEGHSAAPDLIIHVGVSAGDTAIRLEQRARKYGYESADAQGRFAKREGGTLRTGKDEAGDEDAGGGRGGGGEGEGAFGRGGFTGAEWTSAPEELRTHVDAVRVIRWAKEQGVQWISTSEDAGLYLCEYSFFASLATARRLNPDAPTPVQFIHVPSLGHPYSAEELTAALRLLVWGIAEQFLLGEDELDGDGGGTNGFAHEQEN
ncbi:hypothetical protein JCM10908_001947 [Rhodotorula pacifica]|uniref:uncharacterized protein n=1 Tax=Rhodotorula pacifica TaxID=1495444 RepID=UPI00317AD6DC